MPFFCVNPFDLQYTNVYLFDYYLKFRFIDLCFWLQYCNVLDYFIDKLFKTYISVTQK